MKFGYSQVTSAPPGNVGFTGQDKCFLTAHAALTAGDVVEVDFGSASASAPYATDTKAVADDEYGICGVVEEDCASGDAVRVTFRGTLPAQTSGTPAAEAVLSAGSGVLVAAAAASKVVGVALEVGTSSPTHVLFNGIEGFGTNVA